MADQITDNRVLVAVGERYRPCAMAFRALNHRLADNRKNFDQIIKPLVANATGENVDPERLKEGITPVTDTDVTEFMAVMGKVEGVLAEIGSLDIIEKFCTGPVNIV